MPALTPLDLTLLLLAASVIAVGALRLLHLPPLLAYLLVGILFAPLLVLLGGASSIDTRIIRGLGETGVVFLMFSIGLEFNLAKLNAMRRYVFGLGGAQVSITVIAVCIFALGLPAGMQQVVFGAVYDWRDALVLGGALAMSSTALISKLLADRHEMETEHGRRIFGVLLFQDLAVIPFLVLIPSLANAQSDWMVALGWALLKAVVLLVVLLRFGEPVMRAWFHVVARRKSHELFTLNVLLVTLLGAWLSSLAGLPLELGAFVAGMLIAETEYRHQVEEDIKPFRDLLLGLFFITLGMQLDLGIVLAMWPRVIAFALVPMAGKFLLIVFLTRRFGAPQNVALRTGLWLAQASEFAFVMLAMAIDVQLFEPGALQPMIAAMLLSMIISPLLLHNSDRLLLRYSGAEWLQRSLQVQKIASKSIQRDRHVILCGYGRSGQSVAHVLESEKVPFIALDLDPDRVQAASAAGETVVYGDSARREALLAAGIHRAHALVITFADTPVSERVLRLAAELAPGLPVLVRTTDEGDIERLRAAGATEVVPEIVEGSLMLASHALALTGVPLADINKLVRKVRDDQYSLLRGFFHGADDDDREGIEHENIRLRTLLIRHGASAAGRTLSEAGLPAGAKVSAMVRRQVRTLDPAPETILQEGDTLVLAGPLEALADAEARLLRR